MESSCVHSSKPKSECEDSETVQRMTSRHSPLHQQFADFFNSFCTSMLSGRFHIEIHVFQRKLRVVYVEEYILYS